MLFRILLVFFPFLFSLLVQAQTQTDVRKRHIRTSEVITTDFKKNGQTRRTITRYDRKGNVIEQVDYGKISNDIESHVHFQYNRRGKLVTEIHISPVGDTLQIISTYYNRFNHPFETVTKNAKGEIVEREMPKYDNFHRKTEELTFSGSGAITKRLTYQYDSKGMLIARRTYDAEGNLQYEKIYKYEY